MCAVQIVCAVKVSLLPVCCATESCVFSPAFFFLSFALPFCFFFSSFVLVGDDLCSFAHFVASLQVKARTCSSHN